MYVCVFDVLVFNSIQLNFNFLFRLKICMYVCIYWINIYINIFLLIIHSHSINIQSYRSFFHHYPFLSLYIYVCEWYSFSSIHYILLIVDLRLIALFFNLSICVYVRVCVYSSEWIKTTVKKKKGKTYVIKKEKKRKNFVFSNLDPDFLFVWLYQKFVPSINQVRILSFFLFWRKNWWI